MNRQSIPTHLRRHGAARGFSLVEVLMAIFILGIGVISIAALFPAGIVQQRQSVDDVVGAIVANNAVALIRSKVRPEDFGTFEEFNSSSPIVTIDGDWSWLRPAFIFAGGAYPNGAIDLFNGSGSATAFEPVGLGGIPYNSFLYAGRPSFIITQEERYYPMAPPPGASAIASKPQYVWDCMFKRFQGRIQVAIFVYRVTAPGGEAAAYAVWENVSNPQVPPIPVHLDLAASGGWDAHIEQIAGAECTAYDPFDHAQAWQESGQWILDQNNNIHRVLSSYCGDSDRRIAELVRPVPSMPALPVFSSLIDEDSGIVSNIYYVPISDLNGNRLSPVYVTVKEL